MNIPKHPTLIRKMRDARIKKLTPRCVPLAASLGRQVSGCRMDDCKDQIGFNVLRIQLYRLLQRRFRFFKLA